MQTTALSPSSKHHTHLIVQTGRCVALKPDSQTSQGLTAQRKFFLCVTHITQDAGKYVPVILKARSVMLVRGQPTVLGRRLQHPPGGAVGTGESWMY